MCFILNSHDADTRDERHRTFDSQHKGNWEIDCLEANWKHMLILSNNLVLLFHTHIMTIEKHVVARPLDVYSLTPTSARPVPAES